MQLRLHSTSFCQALTSVEAILEHVASNCLIITYTITGRIADIALPPQRIAARSGNLWQHTCFEAFVRASDSGAYYEFNFSPSCEWAAYRFEKYRAGMRDADGVNITRTDLRLDRDSYTLRASLVFDVSFELALANTWHIGLSAVIEEISGRKSYWSLTHPSDKPDFHHPGGFIHQQIPSGSR